MIFFGLKEGQDLENRTAHPHQEFPREPSPPRILKTEFYSLIDLRS